MAIMFLLGMVAGIVIGYIVRLIHDDESLAVRAAKSAMKVAFNESARLSRRIHRQREVIKSLKSQIPKSPVAH